MNRSTRSRPGLWMIAFAFMVLTAGSCNGEDGLVRDGDNQVKCWVANGPRPNTRGQVENIANGEVDGAVNAIAPHPTNADVLYAGGVNGGIWRTDNAMAPAPTWTSQTDDAASLSIGALEFDPTDAAHQTLVAGTGRFSSLARRGGGRSGLLRTTDGSTWAGLDGGGTLLGLNVSGVAPRGATIVISVNDADSSAGGGIWRSTDTGASWSQVSGSAVSGLPTGRSFDLASVPGNATRLFTNAGASGLFRSDDSGATWAKVSNAAMDALIGQAGNIEIAAGNADNVFAAIVVSGRLGGCFRSGDGGATWASLDLPETIENNNVPFGIHPGGQGNIHLSIAADPDDANVVYIGGDRQPCFTESDRCRRPGVRTFPNTLGANNFTGRIFRIDASRPAGSQAQPLTHVGTADGSSPHADSREMDVAANGVLIEADDGGIYRRTEPATANGRWFSMNGDIQTTEFHKAAWDSVGNVVIGGTQDTGTPQQPNQADAQWESVATADGGDVAVDDTGTPGRSVRYSSNQFLGGFRRRVYDSSNVLQSQVFPSLLVAGGGNPLAPQFYTPIELNNVNPDRLIIGAANAVYETFDQGDTVFEIAPGVRVNDGLSSDAIAYGAAGDPNALYLGSGNRVLIRRGGGALAVSATYPGAAPVVDVAIDPADPDSAFVVDGGAVFRTTDAGATWNDVTGDLGTLDPGAIRSLAFRPDPGGRLIVGTDTGVFSAPGPAFNDWDQHACGLPTVPVYDLEYDVQDQVLVAGTLGRGAWVRDES